MPKFYRALVEKTDKQGNEFALTYKVGDVMDLRLVHNTDKQWGWGTVQGWFSLLDTVTQLIPEMSNDDPWCRVKREKNICLTLRHAFALYADKKYLGHRDYKTDGTRGEYIWETYAEVEAKINALGSFIRTLTPKKSMIGICGGNRPEWVIADLTCSCYGFSSVPIHTKSDDATVEFMVNQTEMPVLVCESHNISTFLRLKVPQLKYIIQMDGHKPTVQSPPGGPRIIAFADALAEGRKALIPLDGNEPSDIASLTYTSGSTGTPKGAIMSESRFLSQFSYPFSLPDKEIVTFSYAPFAHMMERQNILVNGFAGGRIALFDQDISHLFTEIGIVAPTWLMAVPRVWNDVYSRFQNRVAESLAKLESEHQHKKMTQAAKDVARRRLENELLADIRASLGGRLEYIVTGGAITNKDTIDFLKRCFKVNVFDGYGTTETAGIAVDDAVVPDCTMRLEDVPELGYLTTDKPFPRGEIVVKTPHTIPGYYKDAKATAENFTADGFFRTGDIGVADAKGRIKVIDRRKNVFKLAQGEFVAPEPLEQLYINQCPLIRQIFLHGGPKVPFLVALVVPNFDTTRKWIESNGIAWEGEEATCKNEQVRQAIRASITHAANANKKQGYEVPQAIHFLATPFSEEQGLITVSNKLRRPQIAKHYSAVLADLFAAGLSSEDELFAMILSGKFKAGFESQDLLQLGYDSLAAMRLKKKLEEKCNRSIPVPLLLSATVSVLSEFIRTAPMQDDAPKPLPAPPVLSAYEEDMAAISEVHALKAQFASLEAGPEKPAVALVTGATGFLGAAVVHSLITKTDMRIVLLIRASSVELAKKRFRESMTKARVEWKAEWDQRLAVLAGDIADPNMGVKNEDLFQILLKEADCIYHVAAQVNWVLPYRLLRMPNVVGTMEVIRLACTGKRKSIFYVSTAGVAEDLADETAFASRPTALTGYSLTKLVAEKYIRAAAEIGVPVQIYRPGLIVGDSNTGFCNPEDYETRYLRGCAMFGSYALDNRVYWNLAPVNYVADCIVEFSRRYDAAHPAQTFLINNRKLTPFNLVGRALDSFGYKVTGKPYTAWREQLIEQLAENPIEPLLSFFPPDGLPADVVPPAPNLVAMLARTGIQCPEITELVVHRWVQYLVSEGHMKPPQAAEKLGVFVVATMKAPGEDDKVEPGDTGAAKNTETIQHAKEEPKKEEEKKP